MKHRIQRKWGVVLTAAALTLAGSFQTSGQTPTTTESSQEQLYVVSAKAGGVSEIEGTAHVKRLGDAGTTKVLEKGDELGSLDRVNTEQDARIEVMLNPGSYLRVGSLSEFELTDTALESLKVKLLRGSALIEATAVGGESGADIAVLTQHTSLELEKSGLYRVNVQGDKTEIYVWKGKARVGAQIVKSGQQIVIGNGIASVIAKIPKDKMLDALDQWSRLRAETLAKLNERLERSLLQRSFASYDYDFLSRYFSGYWIFDRRNRIWCYVPNTRGNCCRSNYGQSYTHKVRVLRGEVPPDNQPVLVLAKRRTLDLENNSSDNSSGSSSNDSVSSPSPKSEPSYSPPPSPPATQSDSTPPAKAEVAPPPAKSDPPELKR